MHNEETFTKEIKTTNINIDFKFKGIPKKENIDYVKINELINSCFDPSMLSDDIIKNITCIRTIFKDFDEKYLKVQIINNKTANTFVQYEDKKLQRYQMTKKINDFYAGYFNMEYKIDEGLKYYFSKINEQIIEYPINQKTLDLINANMKKLAYLNNIKSITLDNDSKALCKIYKLFYNEYPDFSSKEVNIKVQTMMSILLEFGVSLDKEISFIMLQNKIPISIYLQEKVNKLDPLGKIEFVDNSLKLYSEVEKIIKAVGDIIREYIHDNDDEIDTLRRISRVFYASRNCLRVNAKSEEIAEFCSYSKNEVESTLKLIRKIDKKLEN